MDFTFAELLNYLKDVDARKGSERLMHRPVRVLNQETRESFRVASVGIIGGIPMLILGKDPEPDDNDEPNFEYHPGVDGPRGY